MNKDKVEPPIAPRITDDEGAGPADITAATPILKTVLYIMGSLSVLAIIGGIVTIIWNAHSPSEMILFGAKINTGHVGVAFTALGLISMVTVVRSVLKQLRKLAEIKY
jgi:hypothetical protein